MRKSLDNLYDLATGDEDARVCKDIPESACHHLPRNFFAQLIALVATKTGDKLAGPKLVLAWMLSSVGAAPLAISLLVPLREALALLPQLLVAALMRRMAVRKWLWVGGSVAQGLAVIGMGLAVTQLPGPSAGWTVVCLLVFFSLARGICSVAAKDVMGKTVSKTRRGRLTGYAASAAGAVTIAVALFIAVARRDEAPDPVFFLVLLGAAGLLWLLAAVAYSTIAEVPGSTEGGGNAGQVALANLSLLRRDKPLRRFVLTRALLVSTALMAPFLVVLANRHIESSLSDLAIFLIASGVASLISAPAWGRMADSSSRRVLILTATGAAILGLAVFGYAASGAHFAPSVAYPAAYFLLAVIHTGVRIGRKTYLVDIADRDNRAAYVAVSNTVIGLVLLGGGLVGFVAEFAGIESAILLLSLLAASAAVSAMTLTEAQ